jgi:hypothetical protein
MDAQDKQDFRNAHAQVVSLEGSGWDLLLQGVEKIGATALPVLEKVLEEVVPGLQGTPLASVLEAEVGELVDKLENQS